MPNISKVLTPIDRQCHDEVQQPDHDDIHLLVFNPSYTKEPSLEQIKVSFWDRDVNIVEESKQINFNRHELFETNREHMCNFSIRGKMYLAGCGLSSCSYEEQTRLGRIDGDSIVYLDDLKSRNFTFSNGICTSGVGTSESALLCHPTQQKKVCFLWDGDKNWTEIKTHEQHYKGGLAAWSHVGESRDTFAIIFAGRDDTEGFTERLQQTADGLQWSKDKKIYDGLKNYHYNSVVNFDNKVYSFGGQVEYLVSKSVYVYNGHWSQDVDLNLPRTEHRSVVVGEKIIHIGGRGEYSYEIWTSLGKGSWVKPHFNTETKLKDWSKYPNAFAISANDYQ